MVEKGVICDIPLARGDIIKEVFFTGEVYNAGGDDHFAEEKGVLEKEGAGDFRS